MAAAAGLVTVGVLSSTGPAAPAPIGRHLSSTAPVGRTAAVTQSQLIAGLSFAPAGGATGVAPDAPVSVHTRLGRLSSVALTAGSTAPVPGVTDRSGRSWRAAGGLAPSTAYQLAVGVTGPGGTQASVTETFQTLTPTATVSAAITPGDGSTVGVGQPLVLRFDQAIPPAAQATVLSHLTVAETRPVAGGWHWFSDDELHFRPQTFWPSGEQVTLSAALDGWDAGNGAWGSGTSTTHLLIGASHVAVANLTTETMTVSDNGQIIATYPISAGSTEYPTQQGIHITLDKEPVVHMVSGTVGIPTDGPGGYNEYVYNDVHISDSGEYVHDAPWSVGEQGAENVSHGCINLSPTDSKAFYDFSQIGDVVEVVGGTRAPVPSDHGVMDWTLDWGQWTPAAIAPA